MQNKQVGPARWFSDRLTSYTYFTSYIEAICAQWVDLLFGGGVLAVVFTIWWGLYGPTPISLVIAFVIASLVAGYFSWRSEYIKSIPKFEISGHSIKQISLQSVGNTWQCVRLNPKCLSEIPLLECKTNLIGVFKKNQDNKWEKIGPNEGDVLFVKWLDCDNLAISLERHTERLISICYADGLKACLLPDTNPPYSSTQMPLPGNYSFDIKISAEEHPPLYYSVEIILPDRHFYNLTCRVWRGLTTDEKKYQLD